MKAYSVCYVYEFNGRFECSPVCVAFSDPNRAAKKASDLMKNFRESAITKGFDDPGEPKVAVFDGEKFITEGYAVIGWDTIRFDIISDETGERLETYHPDRRCEHVSATKKAREEAEITARKMLRYGIKCHVEEVEFKIRIDEE